MYTKMKMNGIYIWYIYIIYIGDVKGCISISDVRVLYFGSSSDIIEHQKKSREYTAGLLEEGLEEYMNIVAVVGCKRRELKSFCEEILQHFFFAS